MTGFILRSRRVMETPSLLPVLLFFIMSAGCSVHAADNVAPGFPAGDTLVMSDGERLSLRSWLPPSETGAVIVALHGINDYGGAYSLPGTFLSGQGIALYAYDQRGFGSSTQRGLWPGAAALAEDAREAVKIIGGRHPGTPLFLLGESMGGAVAITALTGEGAPEVAGLILVAPAVWGGEHFSRLFRAALGVGDSLAPGLALSGRLSGVTLSDNSELVAAMREDPLPIQKSRIATLDGMVDLMDSALEAASDIDIPLLLLYGLRDEVVPREALCDFLTRPKTRPTSAFYPDGYHLLQ
jgi:alpha-beta hydrolase superfamily lysophospholipase